MTAASTIGSARGLRIDVGTRRVERDELPADVVREFLGGRGLGVYLLLRERAYEMEPLSPESPLIFAPGPLTGTRAPSAGRYSVSARSPLTGTAFDSNSGGAFGIALRRLGLEFLVLTGVSERPSYVVIGDGGVQVLSAESLWELEVPDALVRIKAIHGRCQAGVIGPAGERGVLFASIVNNHGRQVGRGGLGTVMGAKRIKAVVALPGDQPLPSPADPERFDFVAYEARKMLKANPITSQALPEFGTPVLVNVLNQAGALPTRNFRESRFELAQAVSGEALRSGFVEKRTSCTGCYIGCARRTRSGSDRGEGPEYESIWALGPACGIGDLETIVQANYLCNRAGMDTITMGSTIACAMELTEEGILHDGPRFGDGAALLRLVAETAERRDLGDELAEGSARFARRYGRPELSMSVKALELPAYDPRGMTGQGLAFATSNRGGCHLRANMLGPEILGVPKMIDRFATRGKAGLLINIQHLNAVLDSLSQCKFTALAIKEDYFARLLSGLWGETVEPQELLRIGERIWNAERLFNLHCGFTREDDTLPRRLLEEPVSEGPAAGRVVDLSPMLDEYYVARGWDAQGVPQPQKLERLGLTWASPAPGSAGWQEVTS